MPLAFHASRQTKYDQQVENARAFIVPFVDRVGPIDGKNVLEIGCGEGGILEAFVERGCHCVGVDLSESKIEFAREAMAAHVSAGRAEFHAGDIYDAEIGSRLEGRFDLAIMKDTIEHVYGHDRILRRIRDFLAPRGVLFVGFPPWRMPYGGHQQMADTKLGKLPYYHILPRPVYRGLLKAFGEPDERVRVLMEIVDTRLSINRFERLAKEAGYRVVARQFYLVNPIYRYKFGLKPRRQIPVVSAVPWIRDFVTTTCYYLLTPES